MCRAYQLPHSALLAWSKDDRDKAIWEYVRAKQTCRHCGTRPDEWSETKDGRRDAYQPVLTICPGCEQEQFYRAGLDEKKIPKGAYIRLVPRG